MIDSRVVSWCIALFFSVFSDYLNITNRRLLELKELTVVDRSSLAKRQSQVAHLLRKTGYLTTGLCCRVLLVFFDEMARIRCFNFIFSIKESYLWTSVHLWVCAERNWFICSHRPGCENRPICWTRSSCDFHIYAEMPARPWNLSQWKKERKSQYDSM